MGFIKRKHRPEYAAVQREWAMWGKQMEKTLPGYGEQNETLHWMVRILTGVRVLYCLFYLIMTFVYGMEKTNAVMPLLGPFPLVFMLVMAAAIEFIEAVFCIYMLFNPLARHTIRLNRTFARGMRVQVPDEVRE